MGLFSGGFFGGGTDESSSSTTTTTNTTTTNTTRDIGLTGQHAVVMADVITGAGVDIAKIGADQNIDFQQGMFDFAKTLIDGNQQTMRMQKDYEGKFVQYQDQQVAEVLRAGFAMKNPDQSVLKEYAFYMAAAFGLFFIMKSRGR